MQSGFLWQVHSKEKSMSETLRLASTRYKKLNSIRSSKSAMHHVFQSNANHGCSRAKKSEIRMNNGFEPHLKYAKA